MLARKRYGQQPAAPVLFHGGGVVTNAADRQVNPAILYGNLAFCLLLRFEFMELEHFKETGRLSRQYRLGADDLGDGVGRYDLTLAYCSFF